MTSRDLCSGQTTSSLLLTLVQTYAIAISPSFQVLEPWVLCHRGNFISTSARNRLTYIILYIPPFVSPINQMYLGGYESNGYKPDYLFYFEDGWTNMKALDFL